MESETISVQYCQQNNPNGEDCDGLLGKMLEVARRKIIITFVEVTAAEVGVTDESMMPEDAMGHSSLLVIAT